MKASAITLTLLVTTTLLAGCGGTGGDDTVLPPIDDTTGAITGIVLDDRLRPVSAAELLLTPVAALVATDEDGQFSFGNLAPGAYVLLVTAPGHEAAPMAVDVTAGEYTEVQVPARRTFSEGAYTITTQYSVFIPCAIDFVVNGIVEDCTGDQSGDSFRPGFVSDYTAHGKNATYLVTEMLANQKNRYEVQVRCEKGGDYQYYAVARIDDPYAKMTLKLGNVTTDAVPPPEYGTTKWDNKCKNMHTILFADSPGREELQGLGLPVCCGAGVQLGIKARFVQTLFLGPPQVAVETYGVLKPASA